MNQGPTFILRESYLCIAARDIEAKLYTSEALDQARTRFFELSEFTSQLDLDEKERLLKR
jgi:hypothetical protein